MLRYFPLALLYFFSITASGMAQTAHREAKTIHGVILPKVGTMIVNTYFVTDSSGAIIPKTTVDPKMDDDTLIVIQSDVPMLGRANCVELADLTSQDTSIISYAPNGDIYMRNLTTDSFWTLLPFGLPAGHVIRKELPNDTSYFLLHHFDLPHTRTWEVLGTDTASAAGKVYRCVKLQIVDIRKYEGKDWLQGMLYWFSPQLGYFARMNFGWDGPYFLNQQVKVYRQKSNE